MEVYGKFKNELGGYMIDKLPDAGNGALDIKVSRGSDKTITEIKLSSSEQYLRGYETQIELYGKAEQTEKMIYVFIDLGNPVRRKKYNKS